MWQDHGHDYIVLHDYSCKTGLHPIATKYESHEVKKIFPINPPLQSYFAISVNMFKLLGKQRLECPPSRLARIAHPSSRVGIREDPPGMFIG